MGFINEYVSEEDIKKYNLDNLWNEIVFKDSSLRMPESRREALFRYNWSINRTKKCWFMHMRSLPIYDDSTGLLIPGPTDKFLFLYEGYHYIVTLKLQISKEEKNSNVLVRKLISIVPIDSVEFTSDEVLLSYLKKAVAAYNQYGAMQKTPTASVKLEV